MKQNRLLFKLLFLILLFGFDLKAGDVKKKERKISDPDIVHVVNGRSVEQQIASYDSLGSMNTDNDPAFSLMCSNKALELAIEAVSDKTGRIYTTRAKAYKQLAEYDKALESLDSAYSIQSKIKDKKWIESIYIDYGNVYYLTGDYVKSLDNYTKAMRMAEDLKDLPIQALAVNNIGNIYFLQGNYDKAVTYYQKAYTSNTMLKDTMKAALALDNIGLVYINKEEYDMALMYQVSALKMVEKLDNKKVIAEVLMNLGVVNGEKKNYTAALKYYERAYDIYKEIDSKFGVVVCLINIGDNYRAQKKYTEAIDKLNNALDISREIGAKNNEKEVVMNLSQVYEEMNQPQRALEYYKIFSELKDSIYNEESTSQMNELSAKYEADKRQKKIELLTKDQDLKNTKLKQKDTINLALFIGIALVVILMGLVFYRYQEKRKANTLLEEKNIAIHEQKELVTEKNKEITDSINYARRIQDAMLPSQKILNEYFKDNFIFYQPKDIISGDFYWAIRKDNKLYIAAADCTGHGVPGALMSMIGVTFLRQIINEMNITDTAEILNKLHAMVLLALNEDLASRASKDGMDIALMRIDLVNKKAQFTGAVRPLYMFSKNGMEIIKGDRFSIGGVKTMEESFSKIDIDLDGNRSFYLFSDGFADQFGKESGKKFMVKKMQSLLSDIYKKPMEEQSKLLSKTFNDWKGDVDQTDDVLLIGIKV